MPQAASSDSFVIGVDIGGTKVAAGLVDRHSGKIESQSRSPMMARGDASAGFASVVSAIDSLFSKNSVLLQEVYGIGICAPGPLDPKTGVVINPPNVPCWRNFPLADEVSRVYKVPVKVDNDANAAALAEAKWGAGHGHRSVFYATIGTGIGTGIIFDGNIYHGRTGAAAEGGHMTIDYCGPRCGCGKRGCIEILAAGPAIARFAQARLNDASAHNSAILELAGGDVAAVTSEMVGKAYAVGDPLAQQVLLQIVEYLAIWLGSVIDLLEPDVIIMGGGVAAMLEPFFGEIRNRLPGWTLNSRCQEIPLVSAHFGADAGIAGGAALCSSSSSIAMIQPQLS